MRRSHLSSSCRIEELETRRFLSVSLGGQNLCDESIAMDAKRPGGGSAGPAIGLDLVAIHEFGHSLGLSHDFASSSIMAPYYNANYDLNNFAQDPAVIAFQNLYSDSKIKANTTAWKDSLDDHPGDGKVEITYSFILDGARLDNGKVSNLFATFDAKFPAGGWKETFVDALNLWGGVNKNVTFVPLDGDGIENGVFAFNTSGAIQNDANVGDIRIGAHRFDGAGKVLAHTYYPPPNGTTAAGDSHYDSAENWILTAASGAAITSGGNSLGSSSAPALAAAQQLPFAATGTIQGADDLLSDEDVVLA